jgi:hypothetical protein
MTAALLALALLAAEEPVTYSTRLDGEHVYVDVENDSGAAVVVASVVVSFYAENEELLRKETVPCDRACTVAVDEAGTFGPITGPPGWDTVRVTKVYYAATRPAKSATQAPAPPARGTANAGLAGKSTGPTRKSRAAASPSPAPRP